MSLRLSDESILALEAARDRQRRGQPSPPEPVEPVKPTTRAALPPPLPAGSVVLSGREWEAVMHMVETHPETRATHRRAGDRF